MFTKNDLQYGDICILRNKISYIYTRVNGRQYLLNDEGGCISLEMLQDSLQCKQCFDFTIVKVYRTNNFSLSNCTVPDTMLESFYDKIFDRDSDNGILTQEEKEWLLKAISLEDEKPVSISLDGWCDATGEKSHSYIAFEYSDDCAGFKSFTGGEKFTGMEFDRDYTLEELGLE